MKTNLLQLFLVFFYFSCFSLFSQVSSYVDPTLNPNGLIENILNRYPASFSNILSNPYKYQVQIIYTQINRDNHNIPTFEQFFYNVDSKKYFYPASLVKLPCSALALEKLNQLKTEGLTKNSVMITDSAFGCQKKITTDTSAENKLPSVANYIRRMLLVSDNEAYSRTYEFLGQAYINNQLAKKGYNNIRIIHRFDVDCNVTQNKVTNPILFFDSNGKLLYNQPLQTNTIEFKNPLGEIKIGKAFIGNNGKIVNQPKDFTAMNYMSLQDITDILKSIMFPKSVDEEKQFDLSESDYSFLYRYLSMYPRESDFPKYGIKEFEDSYKKYFMYGTYHKKIENDSVRIFNIVGQSYGYLIDCAYIVNIKMKIEFMLSAVIYVNENNILNDGKYEYKTIGFPFLTNLGNVFYDYEYKRNKNYLPDLSIFDFK